MSAVRQYLNFLQTGLNRDADPKHDQLSGDIIQRVMRNASSARLFEVDTRLYERICLDKAHEAIEAMRRVDPDVDLTDAQGLSINLTGVAEQHPFKCQLPFPSMFVTFTRPLALLPGPKGLFAEDAKVIAILIFQDGQGVWIFDYIRSDGKYWIQNVHNGPTGWGKPVGIWMLSVPALLDEISNPARRREAALTTNERYEINTAARRARRRIVPMPYYRIDIRQDPPEDEHEEQPTTGVHVITPQAPLTYRFDVAAHERVLVERGTLPIDPAVALRRYHAGWDIWTVGQPTGVWIDAMERRGIDPRRDGEWLALRKGAVSAAVKGPADAPYVPAVRRL